ncbi:MAG: NADH:flavin oxidoreductase [Candidatus Aureabacteria bacterium]|nr:NADH:flavin oxidoreductase [Candidatus Auribacterota bacterium]
MKVFERAEIGSIELNNRIIRSSTFEGMADNNGFPTEEYFTLYEKLSKNNIGGIITGCTYISKDGKMVQPGQAGIDDDEKTASFKKVTAIVHKNNSKIFMQISHAGRQTISDLIKTECIYGFSDKKSFYFNQKPIVLSNSQIRDLIEKFGDAAKRAQSADFDGIQLHAAHGYLIHQSILSSVNSRADEFGIDKKTKIGTKFLDLIIENIRNKCGPDYPILVKISGSDDYIRKFSELQFIELIRFLNSKQISAIEISYGTMDYALNIFRGKSIPYDFILKHNIKYKTNKSLIKNIYNYLLFAMLKLKTIPFALGYNINFSILAKKYTSIPVISVGGFLNGNDISDAIENHKADFVSLSRALIAEPAFVSRLINKADDKSICASCNRCAIMCDSNLSTRCFALKR